MGLRKQRQDVIKGLKLSCHILDAQKDLAYMCSTETEELAKAREIVIMDLQKKIAILKRTIIFFETQSKRLRPKLRVRFSGK